MKTYITILMTLAFVAADALFYVFAFNCYGDANIITACMLAALIVHAILLYQLFTHREVKSDDLTTEPSKRYNKEGDLMPV